MVQAGSHSGLAHLGTHAGCKVRACLVGLGLAHVGGGRVAQLAHDVKVGRLAGITHNTRLYNMHAQHDQHNTYSSTVIT